MTDHEKNQVVALLRAHIERSESVLKSLKSYNAGLFVTDGIEKGVSLARNALDWTDVSPGTDPAEPVR